MNEHMGLPELLAAIGFLAAFAAVFVVLPVAIYVALVIR